MDNTSRFDQNTAKNNNYKNDNNEIIDNALYFKVFNMIPIGFHYQQFLWNSIYFFIQLISPPYIVH